MRADQRTWQDQARRAEALGYDVLLVADHLVRDARADARAARGRRRDDHAPGRLRSSSRTTSAIPTLVAPRSRYRRPPQRRPLRARPRRRAHEVRVRRGRHPVRDAPAPGSTGSRKSVQVVRGAARRRGGRRFAGEHYEIAGPPAPPAAAAGPVAGRWQRQARARARGPCTRTSSASSGSIRWRAARCRAEPLQRGAVSRTGSRSSAPRPATGSQQLELNVLVQSVVVDRRSGRRGRGAQPPRSRALDPEAALESPFLLLGTPDEIAEDLLDRRERFGISYVVVFGPAMEALAPVVDRLRSRADQTREAEGALLAAAAPRGPGAACPRGPCRRAQPKKSQKNDRHQHEREPARSRAHRRRRPAARSSSRRRAAASRRARRAGRRAAGWRWCGSSELLDLLGRALDGGRRWPGRLRPGRGAACSCRSRSRQCRPSRQRMKRIDEPTSATNGGTRTEPRSRSNTTLVDRLALVALGVGRRVTERHDQQLLVDRADVDHRVQRLVQAHVERAGTGRSPRPRPG